MASKEILNSLWDDNRVPLQNSSSNILTRDAIGNKTDFVTVPYSSGDNSILAFLRTGYHHVHGQSFAYPTTAGSVTLTAGAGAWGTGGSIIEIIPANTLNVSAFDLHWVNVINHSANGEYYLEIYKGLAASEVLIGAVRSWRDSAFLAGTIANTQQPLQIPQQAVNERISGKLYSSGAGADTLDVSLYGHYYA